MSTPTVPTPATGLPVGSFATYVEAQRAVDFLSDEKFHVEAVTIVGSNLQMVERVTGRLSWGRSALSGMVSGLWFGLLVGILLSSFTNNSDRSTAATIGGALIYGAVFGAIFGLASYASSGGRRDFTSRSQIVAGHYDVLCDSRTADQAREILARLSLRNS